MSPKKEKSPKKTDDKDTKTKKDSTKANKKDKRDKKQSEESNGSYKSSSASSYKKSSCSLSSTDDLDEVRKRNDPTSNKGRNFTACNNPPICNTGESCRSTCQNRSEDFNTGPSCGRPWPPEIACGSTADVCKSPVKVPRPVNNTSGCGRCPTGPMCGLIEPVCDPNKPAKVPSEPACWPTRCANGPTERVYCPAEPAHGPNESVCNTRQLAYNPEKNVLRTKEPVRSLSHFIFGPTKTVQDQIKPSKSITDRLEAPHNTKNCCAPEFLQRNPSLNLAPTEAMCNPNGRVQGLARNHNGSLDSPSNPWNDKNLHRFARSQSNLPSPAVDQQSNFLAADSCYCEYDLPHASYPPEDSSKLSVSNPLTNLSKESTNLGQVPGLDSVIKTVDSTSSNQLRGEYYGLTNGTTNDHTVNSSSTKLKDHPRPIFQPIRTTTNPSFKFRCTCSQDTNMVGTGRSQIDTGNGQSSCVISYNRQPANANNATGEVNHPSKSSSSLDPVNGKRPVQDDVPYNQIRGSSSQFTNPTYQSTKIDRASYQTHSPSRIANNQPCPVNGTIRDNAINNTVGVSPIPCRNSTYQPTKIDSQAKSLATECLCAAYKATKLNRTSYQHNPTDIAGYQPETVNDTQFQDNTLHNQASRLPIECICAAYKAAKFDRTSYQTSNPSDLIGNQPGTVNDMPFQENTLHNQASRLPIECICAAYKAAKFDRTPYQASNPDLIGNQSCTGNCTQFHDNTPRNQSSRLPIECMCAAYKASTVNRPSCKSDSPSDLAGNQSGTANFTQCQGNTQHNQATRLPIECMCAAYKATKTDRTYQTNNRSGIARDQPNSIKDTPIQNNNLCSQTRRSPSECSCPSYQTTRVERTAYQANGSSGTVGNQQSFIDGSAFQNNLLNNAVGCSQSQLRNQTYQPTTTNSRTNTQCVTDSNQPGIVNGTLPPSDQAERSPSRYCCPTYQPTKTDRTAYQTNRQSDRVENQTSSDNCQNKSLNNQNETSSNPMCCPTYQPAKINRVTYKITSASSRSEPQTSSVNCQNKSLNNQNEDSPTQNFCPTYQPTHADRTTNRTNKQSGADENQRKSIDCASNTYQDNHSYCQDVSRTSRPSRNQTYQSNAAKGPAVQRNKFSDLTGCTNDTTCQKQSSNRQSCDLSCESSSETVNQSHEEDCPPAAPRKKRLLRFFCRNK